MPNIGPTELIILLVIVLLIFGPKRLPGLGRQLGTGMREFKDSITGRDKDDEERDAFGNHPELTEAPSEPVASKPAASEPVASEEERTEQPAARPGS